MDPRICALCGAAYQPVQPHQRYCTRLCHDRRPRSRAWEDRIRRSRQSEWRVCPVCGSEFVSHPKQRVTFCSYSCSNTARTGWSVVVRCSVPYSECRFCRRLSANKPCSAMRCRALLRAQTADCLICAQPLTDRQIMSKQESCSVAHGRVLWEKRTPQMDFQCARCAAAFRSRSANARFCSRRCYGLWHGRYDPSERIRRSYTKTAWWKKLHAQVLERDQWLCYLCGNAIDPAVASADPWAATVDHVVPVSAGGSHTAGNLRAAHRRCNVEKGDRLYGEELWAA